MTSYAKTLRDEILSDVEDDIKKDKPNGDVDNRPEATDTITPKELLANLNSLLPQFTFQLHKCGAYVERKRSDGQFRRACKHGRFLNECNCCRIASLKDVSIRRPSIRVAKTKTKQYFDAFAKRPAHPEAPIIAFKGNIDAARKKLFTFLASCERVPNKEIGSDCAFSRGTTYKPGQGCISFEGRQFFSHVFAWMVYNNREVPDGFIIRHQCKTNGKNFGCSQPLHLEIGTQRQNMFEDKLRDGTLTYGEKHHCAKITNKVALEIFNSKGSGTRAQRAKCFNVSCFTVKKIDSGESWSHVTGKHTARINERERAQKMRDARQRSAATKQDYDKTIKLIESHNYASDNVKGCTHSTYAHDLCGYPLINMLGHQTRCSIVTWEYYHNNCKPKPNGLNVLHTCDNENCTNKTHLYLGTPSQNQLDRWARTGKKRKRL